MSELSRVSARIAAAAACLQQSPENERTVLSQIQASAVLELVRHVQATDTQKAELAEKIVAAQFESADRATLLEAITVGSAANTRRRPFQDFCSVMNFLTEEEWAKLQDPDVSGALKLDVLVTRCARLSLRCPSEPTSDLLVPKCFFFDSSLLFVLSLLALQWLLQANS